MLIKIDPVSAEHLDQLKADCAGQISSVLDLLSGKLGPAVLAALTDLDAGLFPLPNEIHFSCSCPDWAGMCKHVAATLYAVGVQLDSRPELLFTLREADQHELASAAAAGAGAIADTESETEIGDLTPDGLSAVVRNRDLRTRGGFRLTRRESALNSASFAHGDPPKSDAFQSRRPLGSRGNPGRHPDSFSPAAKRNGYHFDPVSASADATRERRGSAVRAHPFVRAALASAAHGGPADLADYPAEVASVRIRSSRSQLCWIRPLR